jgi:hypothetical protein
MSDYYLDKLTRIAPFPRDPESDFYLKGAELEVLISWAVELRKARNVPTLPEADEELLAKLRARLHQYAAHSRAIEHAAQRLRKPQAKAPLPWEKPSGETS